MVLLSWFTPTRSRRRSSRSSRCPRPRAPPRRRAPVGCPPGRRPRRSTGRRRAPAVRRPDVPPHAPARPACAPEPGRRRERRRKPRRGTRPSPCRSLGPVPEPRGSRAWNWASCGQAHQKSRWNSRSGVHQFPGGPGECADGPGERVGEPGQGLRPAAVRARGRTLEA